jgi:hypothetical protein
MCFGFGWHGLLFGFLVNCIMDAGVLLSWIWQEKRQLSRKVFASLTDAKGLRFTRFTDAKGLRFTRFTDAKGLRFTRFTDAKGLRSPQQQESLFVRNQGAQW